MLIFTRRIGETFKIGDEISVTILSIKGNNVRVGIDAPADVAVHREEIYERINQDAIVTDLTELSRKAQASNELVELQQDKLRYYQAQLEQGEIEQKDLWPLAEALTKARRTASQNHQAYNVALETISREWGGEQWWLVMDLLAEYTNASRLEQP
ncbi:unnamed protein product [Cyprideis torosa]|uniref:Uncharacterized protein n=1 Tax=Cyprideis torosa TaxID=163714 RepID=A0A7R8WTI1_9CRUS|nr:unnamed protein product [Cyprideis torosa]CAG0906158.1 unnamed protein product [Cyprideis torosa]